MVFSMFLFGFCTAVNGVAVNCEILVGNCVYESLVKEEITLAVFHSGITIVLIPWFLCHFHVHACALILLHVHFGILWACASLFANWSVTAVPPSITPTASVPEDKMRGNLRISNPSIFELRYWQKLLHLHVNMNIILSKINTT